MHGQFAHAVARRFKDRIVVNGHADDAVILHEMNPIHVEGCVIDEPAVDGVDRQLQRMREGLWTQAVGMVVVAMNEQPVLAHEPSYSQGRIGKSPRVGEVGLGQMPDQQPAASVRPDPRRPRRETSGNAARVPPGGVWDAREDKYCLPPGRKRPRREAR